MTNPSPSPSTLRRSNRSLIAGLIVVAALSLIPCQLQAQHFQVLHNFTGGLDGSAPYAGLSMDRGGNLYGTTTAGGHGFGTVFALLHRGSGWAFNPLYGFAGGSDGEGPTARVIVGPNGSLYGTTYAGGGTGCSDGYGCGTIFNLRPSPSVCRAALCGWDETVLYRFTGGSDGANPLLGDVIFDQAGNIYGTTQNGGSANCGGTGCGTVFELSPNGGGWTEKVLYSFTGASGDGANPYSGVILDQSGNLDGTTRQGGPAANGTVFRLTPNGSSWTESILYGFPSINDGYWPYGGLMLDHSGNLFGTTSSGGPNGGGTAFEVTTSGSVDVFFNFAGPAYGGPYGTLTSDAAGNLYGVAYDDGAYGNGSVFKLTPTVNGWSYTDLYDFTGGTDGRCPYGGALLDAQGNLYGTAAAGGQYDVGVVWELTP